MPPESDTFEPLLQSFRDHGLRRPGAHRSFRQRYGRQRQRMQLVLASKQKHYFTMALVALDVVGLLADIFVSLIACDMGESREPWVSKVNDSIATAGLVFSCLFLVELILCVWAFGFRYFFSWFHCLDSLVIIASFVIDLLSRGVLEEIASLVVMLRLWRFVKIVEEIGLGASERLEELEVKLDELQKENESLRNRLLR